MQLSELTTKPLFIEWRMDDNATQFPQADDTFMLDCCSFEIVASYSSDDGKHELQMQVTNIDVTIKDGEIVRIQAPFRFEEHTFVNVQGLDDDTQLCDGLCLADIDELDLPSEIKTVIDSLANRLQPIASNWDYVQGLHREQW